MEAASPVDAYIGGAMVELDGCIEGATCRDLRELPKALEVRAVTFTDIVLDVVLLVCWLYEIRSDCLKMRDVVC
jgi:hypothetical protein